MKIGILDSGIGGLTVLDALINSNKKHEYIYFGDTLHVPYGEKTKEEIISYANRIIKYLEECGVSLIIIACGTLSGLKDDLKSKKIIIDLLSPLNNKLDNYHKISIIATPLSIKTNAFKKYIHTNLNLIPCPKLVPIIESNNYQELDSVLKEYLQSTKDSDALILGCTHYPIIRKEIEKYFKKDIITLDKYLLAKIENLEETKFSLKICFSKINETLIDNTKRILKREDLEIERVNLDD